MKERRAYAAKKYMLMLVCVVRSRWVSEFDGQQIREREREKYKIQNMCE